MKQSFLFIENNGPRAVLEFNLLKILYDSCYSRFNADLFKIWIKFVTISSKFTRFTIHSSELEKSHRDCPNFCILYRNSSSWISQIREFFIKFGGCLEIERFKKGGLIRWPFVNMDWDMQIFVYLYYLISNWRCKITIIQQ